MKKILLTGTFLIPVLLLLIFTSCKKESRSDTAEESLSVASKNVSESSAMHESNLLQSVRGATSRFHSFTQAIMAGYEEDDHCVSVPGLGGMGYHWANPLLVDPFFDPLKPEVVLYARGPGGNLRLVALEYIVINVGQPRPLFGDQPFDVGGTPVPVPHWSLHVWLYENNPSGMFRPFNPNISCP
jgi:hypothetical protein